MLNFANAAAVLTLHSGFLETLPHHSSSPNGNIVQIPLQHISGPHRLSPFNLQGRPAGCLEPCDSDPNIQLLPHMEGCWDQNRSENTDISSH